MKWDAKNPVVPFSMDGSQMLDYPGWDYQWVGVPETFEATMRLIDTYRGRSAVRFILESEDGIQYPAFLADIEYMIKNSIIDNGVFERRTWRFVKRGANYGIALVK